jgi:DNA-binding NarL/FixJ family response regulator
MAVVLARVIPLGRSHAGEQTETMIATFHVPPGTLVVVDDHAWFREVVGERLAAAGWRIVGEAATGAAAIDLVARLAPDIVLLDVVLPDMDGFAVADRLAAAGSASAVVLTSGHERGDFAGRVRAAPVRGFLPKEMISGPALATLLACDQP